MRSETKIGRSRSITPSWAVPFTIKYPVLMRFRFCFCRREATRTILRLKQSSFAFAIICVENAFPGDFAIHTTASINWVAVTRVFALCKFFRMKKRTFEIFAVFTEVHTGNFAPYCAGATRGLVV
jgi:hypothetical protein